MYGKVGLYFSTVSVKWGSNMKQSCNYVDGSALIQKQWHSISKLRTYNFTPEDLDGKATLSIYIFAFQRGERKLMKLTQCKYVFGFVFLFFLGQYVEIKATFMLSEHKRIPHHYSWDTHLCIDAVFSIKTLSG